MKIFLGSGIDRLLFGMMRSDVVSIYGLPNNEFKDDDGNLIYTYDSISCRLTFYSDENLRLGYIISSNYELRLADHAVIGQKISVLKEVLREKGIKEWEQERFDITENHFNESNWLILQSEFGVVVKVEIGAIINDKDEFEWKYNK